MTDSANYPIIGTKKVVIDGKEHEVKILAPGPEWHDEVVWSQPKAGTRHATLRTVAALDGGLTELIGTEQ